MQKKHEAQPRAGRLRTVLSVPIAFLFLAAAAGWLLALLRGRSPWWLEATVLAVSVLAVAYLVAMQYWLHSGSRSRPRSSAASTPRMAPRSVDPLTAPPSRAWLEKTLAAELARSRRYHRHLSLVVLDIDHFTRMNRDHGDIAGDWVLESVGSLLRSSVRESDYIARIGDDSFALVLAETPEKGALLLAEKLHAAVAGLSAAPAGKVGPRLAVSVSIGVAAANESDSVKELLRRGEAAAMTARRDGGDRVATATF